MMFSLVFHFRLHILILNLKNLQKKMLLSILNNYKNLLHMLQLKMIFQYQGDHKAKFLSKVFSCLQTFKEILQVILLLLVKIFQHSLVQQHQSIKHLVFLLLQHLKVLFIDVIFLYLHFIYFVLFFNFIQMSLFYLV